MREPLDLAGIGIGPFNLSLAALLDRQRDVSARFCDAKPAFNWHSGMMLPNVELQSSYLKDLVTPVDPTNRWSFVNYLVEKRRLFTFLNAQYAAVPRQEMANYFAWAAEGISSLCFGMPVEQVTFEGEWFNVTHGDGSVVSARNIAIGTGSKPYRPSWAANLPKQRCFHVEDGIEQLKKLASANLVVIGGGQSGGEFVDQLLTQDNCPGSIRWLSRRHNFEPINETAFSNQVFCPEYVSAYRQLTDERKTAALSNSILTSDGLSLSTINSIYRTLYRLRHIESSTLDLAMMPSRNVVQVEWQGGEFRLIMRNGFDGAIEVIYADTIVLATGFRFALPDALAPIAGRLQRDGQGRAVPGEDYALAWDGPLDNRIYAQNAGRLSHGIADSQLSLAAWRAAIIANSLVGEDRYDLSLPDPVLAWASRSDVPAHALGRAGEN